MFHAVLSPFEYFETMRWKRPAAPSGASACPMFLPLLSVRKWGGNPNVRGAYAEHAGGYLKERLRRRGVRSGNRTRAQSHFAGEVCQ